jgi:type I restriction enzyme S subunit
MARDDDFVDTDLGPLPASWEIRPFQELLEAKLGKMLSQKSKTGTSSRPYVRNANVQWDKVDISDLFKMDFLEKERKRRASANFGQSG